MVVALFDVSCISGVTRIVVARISRSETKTSPPNLNLNMSKPSIIKSHMESLKVARFAILPLHTFTYYAVYESFLFSGFTALRLIDDHAIDLADVTMLCRHVSIANSSRRLTWQACGVCAYLPFIISSSDLVLC